MDLITFCFVRLVVIADRFDFREYRFAGFRSYPNPLGQTPIQLEMLSPVARIEVCLHHPPEERQSRPQWHKYYRVGVASGERESSIVLQFSIESPNPNRTLDRSYNLQIRIVGVAAPRGNRQRSINH